MTTAMTTTGAGRRSTSPDASWILFEIRWSRAPDRIMIHFFFCFVLFFSSCFPLVSSVLQRMWLQMVMG